LLAGVFVTLLGLSGSVILFRNDIHRAANSRLLWVETTGAPQRLEFQAGRVLGANPGARISFVRLPQDLHGTTQFFLEGNAPRDPRNKSVFVNPYTAEILGSEIQEVRWLNWLEDWHKNLFLGRTGRWLHGFIALFLLTLSLTGMVVWWPGRGHWKRAVVPNTSLRGWRLAFALHKSIGFWMFLFLTGFALTAVPLSWNVSKLVYWMTRSVPKNESRQRTSWKIGDPWHPLDDYVRKASETLPHGEATFVRLPSDRETVVTVGLRLPTDFRREGAQNTVELDPSTCAVLRVDRMAEAPRGERLLASASALHFGEFGVGSFGDLPTKIVWSVIGLAPGLLFVTGFVVWWSRDGRKVWIRRSDVGSGDET
jgi:uncharacterized iron-regulated membrane protein